MPEIVNERKIFSLLEVTASIQKTLSMRYTSSFWIKAEMNKLNYYPHSGHCYPELVEKLEGSVVAQIKSTLWKDDYIRINESFIDIVKVPLKDGIKMLFCARITFDPVYGLALRIVDIDPVFSLGELEREKQASIALLKEEGSFNRNKSLNFPLLPKRLAVISVQTSKGYADFLKMIEQNPWGYRFIHVLFPSLLQGDKAAGAVRYQLEKIRKIAHHFDVVAIVRGGGGDVGLSCFNDYELSRMIALFPIPVLTGIGHATNETVVEMVAYRNAITPTELADYLLQKFHNFSIPIQKAEETLAGKARRIVTEERQRLQHTVKYFRSITDNVLMSRRHDIQHQARDLFKQANLNVLRQKQERESFRLRIQSFSLSLCNAGKNELRQSIFMLRKSFASFVKAEAGKMDNLEKSVANMHPENVLKRGYSITRLNGKAITRLHEVRTSDLLQTILSDGSVISEVKSTKESHEL